MVGFPNNYGVFLQKMIILGCEMGVPPFKETPIYIPITDPWDWCMCLFPTWRVDFYGKVVGKFK